MKKYLQAAIILGFLEFIILYLSNNGVRLIGLFLYLPIIDGILNNFVYFRSKDSTR
jgi:hypothetical protein